ncbi:MAG: Uma2 family endonuclease [Dehalococcoidia bacterium]|nr:Uma2 family endonuclease [Dehalococcoidia bacterium]
MVTTTPKEPTEAADLHYVADMPMASGSELRLNLKALGVDGSAPDFGERLVQLTRDNEPYDFQFSARGELIVMAPSGSESNLGETVINAVLTMWQLNNTGRSFSQTSMFQLPSGAILMPDAAWITQERFDNRTEQERRAAINGAPDFVVEVRSLSDRLPPLLAKMAEWMDAGARLGWMLDPMERRVYIFRPGREIEILENPAVLYGEDVLPGFVFEVGRLMFGHE